MTWQRLAHVAEVACWIVGAMLVGVVVWDKTPPHGIPLWLYVALFGIAGGLIGNASAAATKSNVRTNTHVQ